MRWDTCLQQTAERKSHFLRHPHGRAIVLQLQYWSVNSSVELQTLVTTDFLRTEHRRLCWTRPAATPTQNRRVFKDEFTLYLTFCNEAATVLLLSVQRAGLCYSSNLLLKYSASSLTNLTHILMTNKKLCFCKDYSASIVHSTYICRGEVMDC